MSKNWPPHKTEYTTGEETIINGREVTIFRVVQGESLGFELNGIYFEIHKMTRSKSGGRNMKIVAWKIGNLRFIQMVLLICMKKES